MTFKSYIKEQTAKWQAAGKEYRPPAQEAFIAPFESGQRITVSFRDSDGVEYERARGTIAMTTGWSPAFMLMLRKNSIGSRHLISDRDRIVA